MRKLKPAIPLAGALVLGFMALVPLRTAAQEAWSLQRCLDHAFEHNIQIQLGQLGETSAAIACKPPGFAEPQRQTSHGYTRSDH